MNPRLTSVILVVASCAALPALHGCGGGGTPSAPPRDQAPPTPAPAPANPPATATKPADHSPTISMAPGSAASTTKPGDVTPTHAPAPPPATKPALPPAGSTPASTEDRKTATFGGLSGPKPVTWQWHQPTRQFNIAEYIVPGQNGSDQATLTVITAGGTIEQNVERLKGQFRSSDGKAVEPKIEKFTANGLDITVLEFAGEYRGMRDQNFTPDTLFLAGIVPAPAGQLFVRLVGPTATVEANRAAFMELLRGLKKVEAEK